MNKPNFFTVKHKNVKNLMTIFVCGMCLLMVGNALDLLSFSTCTVAVAA